MLHNLVISKTFQIQRLLNLFPCRVALSQVFCLNHDFVWFGYSISNALASASHFCLASMTLWLAWYSLWSCILTQIGGTRHTICMNVYLRIMVVPGTDIIKVHRSAMKVTGMKTYSRIQSESHFPGFAVSVRLNRSAVMLLPPCEGDSKDAWAHVQLLYTCREITTLTAGNISISNVSSGSNIIELFLYIYDSVAWIRQGFADR